MRISRRFLIALASALLLGAVPGGQLRGAGALVPESWVFIPEVLSSPRVDGIVVSLTPRVASDWCIDVDDQQGDIVAGTNILYSTCGTPTSASAGTMVVFNVDDQISLRDTRYYYRLRARKSGETAWKYRPLLSFMSFPGANSRWKFAVATDSHWIAEVIQNNACGTNNATGSAIAMSSGIQHLRSRILSDGYRFIAIGGDEQMTHMSGGDGTCQLEASPGVFVVNQDTADGATQNDADNEAKSRWARWLRDWAPAISIAPVVPTSGNHDTQVQSFTGESEHTPRNGLAALNARKAYLPNFATYYYPNGRTSSTGAEGVLSLDCTSCSADGWFYGFDIGRARMVVLDNLVNSGRIVGGLGKYPTAVQDWRLGANGCNAAGGADGCPEGEQGQWASEVIGGLGNNTAAWTFVLQHHMQGGMPRTNSVGYYGRGGKRTTTSMPVGGRCATGGTVIGAYCIGPGSEATTTCPAVFTAGCTCGGVSTRCTDDPASANYAPDAYGYCVDNSTGEPFVFSSGSQTGMGRGCAIESDCDQLGAGYGCAYAFGGLETDPFAGEQENIHQWMRSAAIDNDGAGFGLYGHDHFEAWGRKLPDPVYYVLAGKFTRLTDRTSWADDAWVASQYAYRGGVVNPECSGVGCGGVYDSSIECDDDGNCGDMARGFQEVEVFKDESVVIRKVSNESTLSGPGEYVAKMIWNVDKSKPSTTDRHADFSTFYDAATFGTVNIAKDASTDTSYQLGANDGTAIGGTWSTSTDVPGVYGPSGSDPRLSGSCAGASQLCYDAIPNTSNQFSYNAAGVTVCSWYKSNVLRGHAIAQANDNDANTAQWGFRILDASNIMRIFTRATQTDSATLTGHTFTNWHHYCFTRGPNNGSVKFWVDGLPVACATNCNPTSPTLGTGTELVIGNNTTAGTQDIDGWQHDTVIYDEEMRSEEICKIARCGSRNDVRDRGFPCEFPPGQVCRY